MFLEDPTSFMADFGSPVIFGSYTTTALFDRPDNNLLGGRSQSTEYRIEYPASDLPGLANGSTLLIGIGPGWGFDASGLRLAYSGCSSCAEASIFRVMGVPSKIDDGTFLEARLEKVET